MFIYTILCKVPSDGRGEYSEEIEVEVPRRSVSLAMRKAEEILARDYDPDLKPVRAILTWES